MISWSKTVKTELGTITFRQKHPSQSSAGRRGLFALTQTVDFQIQMLWVEAANDLAEAESIALDRHPIYATASQTGHVGVAICHLPKSTEAQRLRIAAAINREMWPERRAA